MHIPTNIIDLRALFPGVVGVNIALGGLTFGRRTAGDCRIILPSLPRSTFARIVLNNYVFLPVSQKVLVRFFI